MKFITEFENTYEAYGEPVFDKMYKSYKDKHAMDIGNEIADAFGWKTDEQRFKVRTNLSIEAFPMDKWVEFRNRLISECMMPYPNGVEIRELLSELESFGKPAGEKV